MPDKMKWKELKEQIKRHWNNHPDLKRVMKHYGTQLEEEVKKIEAAGLTMEDCIQIGSKSMKEMLQDVEEYHEMSKEDKGLLITYFVAGASFLPNVERPAFCSMIPVRDGIQVKSLVTRELPGRMSSDELSLWDKFCNFIGFKTERYRRYDESQAEYERVRQIREQEQQKTEEMKQQVMETLIEKKCSQLLKTNKTEFKNAAYMESLVQTQKKKWNKLFFKNEKLDDWEFEDGTKLTALEACMGILHGELGFPGNYLTAIPEDADEIDSVENIIKEAVFLYRRLLEQREKEKQEFINSGKEGSYKMSNKLSMSMKRMITNNFTSSASPLYEEYLEAVQSNNRENMEKVTALVYPAISIKAKLYEVTGCKLYEPTLEEEMVISAKMRINLENKMYHAAKDRRYSDFQAINKKAMTVSVYEDGLKKLAEEEKKYPEQKSVSATQNLLKLRSSTKEMITSYIVPEMTTVGHLNAAHLVMQNKLTEGFHLNLTMEPDHSLSCTGCMNRFNLFDEIEMKPDTKEKEGELSVIVEEPELENPELIIL